RITLGQVATKRADVVEFAKLHAILPRMIPTRRAALAQSGHRTRSCANKDPAQANRFPDLATMNEWLDDFKTAVAFLTRLPMPHPLGPMPPNFVRAHRMFPVVGALIGAAIGLFCLALRATGLPDLASSALALGAGMILTGGLHEDGLADVADGFGGGRDTAAKLEIMRD